MSERKDYLAIVVATAACLSLGSCHSHRGKWVAVVPETTAEELWEAEHAGVERVARQAGVDVYWNGPSREDDISRQIEIVDRAVDAGTWGLVLSPDHGIALISAVRRALDRNIPTVIVDSTLEISSGSPLYFVENDEAAAGALAAMRSARYVRSGDAVAVLGVNPNLPTTVACANAFEAELHKLRPGVQIVERRNTSFSFPEAEEAAEEAIRFTSGLKVILGLTVNQTRGAYQALQDDRIPSTIKLIGIDQDLDLLHHLRSGTIDAIVAKSTVDMGAAAIRLIEASHQGKPVPEHTTFEPTLVTTDDVDTPAVQRILDMGWREQ